MNGLGCANLADAVRLFPVDFAQFSLPFIKKFTALQIDEFVALKIGNLMYFVIREMTGETDECPTQGV